MIIRVLKNGNYTTMSNYHFKEKNMSLSNLYNLNEIKKYINKNRTIK